MFIITKLGLKGKNAMHTGQELFEKCYDCIQARNYLKNAMIVYRPGTI